MNIGAAEIEPCRFQRGAGAAQCRLGLVALGVQHIELSGRRLDGALVVLQCGLFGEQVGLGLLRALHGRVTALGKLLKPGIFLPCKRQIGLGRRYIGARLRDNRFLQRDLGVDVADIGLGRVDVGLGFRDRSGVVARIDPHQHLAGLDMLVVGDEQLVHITGDLRRDHGHVGSRIGIIGRFEPAQCRVPVPAEIGRTRDNDYGDDGRDEPAPMAGFRGLRRLGKRLTIGLSVVARDWLGRGPLGRRLDAPVIPRFRRGPGPSRRRGLILEIFVQRRRPVAHRRRATSIVRHAHYL